MALSKASYCNQERANPPQACAKISSPLLLLACFTKTKVLKNEMFEPMRAPSWNDFVLNSYVGRDVRWVFSWRGAMGLTVQKFGFF
jgi:hypothetical protein